MRGARLSWLRPAAVGLLALLMPLIGACGGDDEQAAGPVARQQARSVILLIGDGMGVSQRTAARLLSQGRGGQLRMETLPVAGMARNWSTDGIVTDSAAAATALSTGVKTYNEAIAVDPAGQSVPTILEKAQQAGKAAGLVTDVPLAHATPASFAAHNPDRHAYAEVALGMFNHGVNVLLGGGEDYLLPAGTAGCYPDDGDRQDGRNLVQEAADAGYAHVCTAADLAALDPAATDLLLGTFADYAMVRPQSPTLAEMTTKALAVLDRDPDGFFLMVEGGQIDPAAEGSDAVDMMADTLAFDGAVQVAIDYQAAHPETLVIVTADHSTGGPAVKDVPTDGVCSEQQADDPRECLTVMHEDGPFMSKEGATFWLDWSTILHDGSDVPVAAIGPGAGDLAGYYENTHVYEVMRDAMALQE